LPKSTATPDGIQAVSLVEDPDLSAMQRGQNDIGH